MTLHFKTFGVPELFAEHNGARQSLRLRYRKAHALLGYLAVEHGRWHPRRRLADIFWPTLAPDAALANLRLILKCLNDALAGAEGARCLKVERERLGLFFDPSLRADVLLLQEDTLEALRRCARQEEFTRHAAAWGTLPEQMEGEFLAGIDADDCGEFEDWLLLKRAFFDRARADYFRECVLAARRAGLREDALKATRAWVRCQPVSDEAAQAQMEQLAALDRPAAALEAHADFARRLKRLVDGVAGADTEALRQRIAAAMSMPRAAEAAANTAIDPGPPDEVRRVVMLQVEPELNDEAESLEPERTLAPLEAAFDAALGRWNGQRQAASGLALGAVFGLADDGEQAPRRALRAALEISALPAFGRTRIGICEGKALVCPAALQPLAGSALPTLAQRLSLCGDAGEVIVAESLAGELGPHARFEPMARRRFTGLAGEHTPCRLMMTPEVDGNPWPSVFSSPFVGRIVERERFSAAIDAARAQGHANFIELIGPAGEGKSRLLAELAQQHRAAGGEFRWIAHRPELRHVALGALREALRRRVGSTAEAGLDAWLQRLFPEQRDALRSPLRALLALEGDSAVSISARSLMDALITLLFSPSRTDQPVLLVLDDLHWADEATQELLRIAMQSPPQAPVLAVLSGRPSARVAPPDGVALAVVTLPPLALDEAADLIAAIDQDNRISAKRRAQLAKMSGGLPLCAEYIARTERDQPVSDASLFGVLQGVLDRMGSNKPILQAASVLGASFSEESLRALLPDADLAAALRQAEALAITIRTGEDTHAFRHALLRDCACESIPPRQRRDWHHRAATWLSRRADAAPADIAQHFEAAQAWSEARAFWWKAAEKAYLGEFARDAREAAVRALAAATKDDPPLAAAEKAELELLAGYATLMAEGYGAKEARRFFEPTVARGAGEVPDETLFRALSGMAAATPLGRGETLAIMRRLDDMARTPAHQMMVCYGLGNLMFWRGEFAESLRNFEEALRLGEAMPAHEWLRYSADNPMVACHALTGINLGFSGDPEAARQAAQRAVADARREGRAHALCFALTMAASLELVLDDAEATARFAAEGLELATQWHFPLWRAYNTLFGMWAKARQGKLRLRASFKLVSMHGEFAAASRLSPVTAMWFAGCIFEALEYWSLLDTIAGRALAAAEDGGDRYCLPDLMRQKAIARHSRGDARGARQWLQKGITEAEHLGSAGLLRRLLRLGERIGIAPAVAAEAATAPDA